MKFEDITPRQAYLALTMVSGLGPWRLRKLIDHWKSPVNLIFADENQLFKNGLNQEQINLIKQCSWVEIKKLEKEWCQRSNRFILTWDDGFYPSLLLEIPTPPPIIFCQGDIRLLSQPQLAIVGSRKPSVYGIKLAQKFSQELAETGLVITSGLAAGIDGVSHRGALLATGKTIAVLGSGLDQVYPSQHQGLANQIVQAGGLLISEFLPNDLPRAAHFPQRNRVISGLALGVLVVEATLRSGSLITARLAAEYGREVFALPGAIHHFLAQGCNSLIQQGAKLVNDVDDILPELQYLIPCCNSREQSIAKFSLDPSQIDKSTPNFKNKKAAKILKSLQNIQRDGKVSRLEATTLKSTLDQELDPESLKLLRCIDFMVTSVETIMERSGFSIQKVLVLIATLELKNYIGPASGGFIRLE